MPEPRRSWSRLIVTRAALVRLGVLLGALAALALASSLVMFRMPGQSHRGPLPPLTDAETALAAELRADVEMLAGEIGARNVSMRRSYAEAADRLERALAGMGYAVERQVFEVDGVACVNLWVELAGVSAPGEIVVVGAHYDTCFTSPGANDNGSGVAATLALARRFAADPATRPARTLRFVLFANEEPPYFTRAGMGSRHYARACRVRGDDVVAMLSLETIGYYADEPGSQKYPPPLGLVYPSTGNFIAFVGNVRSRRLVRQCIGRFRETTAFPSEGGAIPGVLPGVGWSDHWSFWKSGYAAVMVTDTAPFRYPHYHRTTDTPDRLDYDRMARVVRGVEHVVRTLAGAP